MGIKLTVSALFPPAEQRTTPQGQVYFIHRATGVSTWHDPRFRDLDVDPSALDPLGDAWEIRFTAHGRRYFVDHINRTTQFTGEKKAVILTCSRSFVGMHTYRIVCL